MPKKNPAEADSADKKKTSTDGPQDVLPATMDFDSVIKPFDLNAFKAWGINDDDLPKDDCAAVVTKNIDSR